MRHDDGMQLELNLPNGTVTLPAFFPDATRGAVRCADVTDLESCRVEGLVMNAYHLMTKPGKSVVKSLGGLHSFTGWKKPILTDSGGFQVFSLIRENPKFGEINASRIIFRPGNENSGQSARGSVKIIFTPEKCIQSQFAYGSDIMMCLDYCTHPDDSYEINKKAVEITIGWAKRCRKEYDKLVSGRRSSRPLLFGIIQGGNDRGLRKECAGALIDIGFDGFGFGGWPLDSNGALVTDILEYTASLMPDGKVKYAMGVGKPENIVRCAKMGYSLFDCVIPTRDARHNRLYVFSENGMLSKNRPTDSGNILSNKNIPGEINSLISTGDFYSYYYPLDEKHIRGAGPVSEFCDCLLCKNHSRAYLRHLIASGDSTGSRLATIHNLRFYTMLMEALRHDG